MSLLQQIQESVVEEGSNLGSILLKLRLLAARLGSDTLAEWVKYECEGYPQEAEVPQYRKVGLTYKGTFSGPMGARIENSPIPPILIEEHAGKRWVTYDVRESIAGIEYLALDSIDGGEIGVDASNLILFLHNKIYENYSCNEVKAQISRVDISEIQQVVRSRILELTIEIEQSVPEALNVTFGSSSSIIDTAPETIQKISQQIIYGNVANAITGDVRNVNISVMKGDIESFKSFLVDAGFPQADVLNIAEIISNEESGNETEPFGVKAKEWFSDNIKKAVNGSWNIGISVATTLLTDATLKYYGLK